MKTTAVGLVAVLPLLIAPDVPDSVPAVSGAEVSEVSSESDRFPGALTDSEVIGATIDLRLDRNYVVKEGTLVGPPRRLSFADSDTGLCAQDVDPIEVIVHGTLRPSQRSRIDAGLRVR